MIGFLVFVLVVGTLICWAVRRNADAAYQQYADGLTLTRMPQSEMTDQWCYELVQHLLAAEREAFKYRVHPLMFGARQAHCDRLGALVARHRPNYLPMITRAQVYRDLQRAKQLLGMR